MSAAVHAGDRTVPGTIRQLSREDAPAIARVFERVVRQGAGEPPPALVEFFRRTLFDQPWADPQISSLGAEEDGELVAMLAVQARRVRIDGRPARLAVSSQLAVSPSARRPALGALLLREHLRGPQALTVSDGGTELVRAIWERSGGAAAQLRCIEWIRPLRPVALGASYLRHRRGDRSARTLPTRLLDRGLAPALEAALRVAGARAQPVRVAPGSATAVELEPLTPATFVEHLPRFTRGIRIALDQDLPFAEWLFRELQLTPGRGRPIARLVSRRGVPVGMFVYFLKPDGMSLVAQVVGCDEAGTRATVDALVEDARQGGAAGVYGRMEAGLLQAVAAAGGLLVYGGNALVHASSSDLAALMTSPDAFLTRLEGERWMAPHLL